MAGGSSSPLLQRLTGKASAVGATQRGNDIARMMIESSSLANPPPVSPATYAYAPMDYVVPAYNGADYSGLLSGPFGFVLNNTQPSAYQPQSAPVTPLYGSSSSMFSSVNGLLGGK